jgi:hypothetical protein
MSSSGSVHSSHNAKKQEPGSNVTCSRCGLVQTVKSFKRHFPQCLGSSNLRTSVSNDTLVPLIDPDKRDCDPMVDDLSEPDFVFVTRRLNRKTSLLVVTMMMMMTLTSHPWISLPWMIQIQNQSQE